MDLLPVIETDRLRLRCWRVSDAPALAANMTPAVTRYLASWPDPTTVEHAAERIARVRIEIAAGLEAGYGVERLSDGAVIGGIGIRVGGFNPRAAGASTRAELGYHLGEAFHGHGYMTEAAEAALDAAWAVLPGVLVIEAGVLPGNPGSEGVLRKLGMTRVGNRLVHSPARRVDELCHCYEIACPGTAAA